VTIELNNSINVPRTHPDRRKPNGKDNIPIPIKVFMQLKMVCGAVESPVIKRSESALLVRLDNKEDSSLRSKLNAFIWSSALSFPLGLSSIALSVTTSSSDVHGLRSSSVPWTTEVSTKLSPK
jgi:hypothetical protein